MIKTLQISRMEKKFNFVYITTNLINGKQYVGDHSTNNLEKDKYLGSGTLLFKKLNEYSRENFKREIIKFFPTKEKAYNAQEKYIKKYNTLIPNGYNIDKRGGFHFASNEMIEKMRISKIGKIQSDETKEKRRKSMLGKNTGKKSEETKRKISEAKKGNPPWNIGKTFSEETKQKMRKPHKKFSEETKQKMSNFQKGRIKSKEERKHISESKKGIKNPMYGKIPWNKKIN